jgi:hypothetical protein
MDGMNALGVEQNAFCQCGFTGINMGTDTDVSNLLNIRFHGAIL